MQEGEEKIMEAIQTIEAPREALVLSANQVRAQVQLIQEVMRDIFIGPTKENPNGTHYGPGFGSGDDKKKSVLLKAGAEKLCLTFRMAPEIFVEDLSGEEDGIRHKTFRVKTRIVHAPTGQVLGEGIGEASTLEEKWAWREALEEEYAVALDTHRRLKWKKKWDNRVNDGRGAYVTDKAIKQIRTNPSDLANTVLKMAKKRSLVDGVITATAASDIFTQDIEEVMQETSPPPAPKPAQAPTKPKATRSPDKAPRVQPAPEEEAPAQPDASAEVKEEGPGLPLGEEEERFWNSLVRLAEAVGAPDFWPKVTNYKNKDGKVTSKKDQAQAEEQIHFYAGKGWDKKFLLPWLIAARQTYLTEEENKILASFSKLGIHSAQLEEYLGEAFYGLSADQVDDLWEVCNKVKAGTPFDEATSII